MSKVRTYLNRHKWVIGFISFWFGYFALFWSRSYLLDSNGNLYSGHVNLWGDWAAHFTMGSSMAYRRLVPIESPFLVGQHFSYPFIADLISGWLIRVGVPFLSAFIVPSFIFSCVIVLALYAFYRVLFKSSAVALVASLIFLLNGGIGWWYFAQDVLTSPAPLATVINPPHEYTRLDREHLKWISVIDSMIIPQRAFTMGFPLTLIALTLLYLGRQELVTKKSQLRLKGTLMYVGAPSLILGLMPLIHTHSFLATGMILLGWSSADVMAASLTDSRGKRPKLTQILVFWAVVASIALIIALPLLKLFILGQTSNFVSWYPGWLARDFHLNWLVFWFKNWGITPVLAAAGWWLILRSQQEVGSYLRHVGQFIPFFVLFIMANLVLFQPYAWDNTKLFAWVSVGFSGLAAYLLLQWWRTYRYWWSRLGVCLIFCLTTASGAIDAYWIQRIDLHHYQSYSAEELELTNWVVTHTPNQAVWLTGDQHNHWLFNLAGRQPVMAYRGWLWTHGYQYRPVEKDVSSLLTHPQPSPLWLKYRIDYVVIGPNELKEWRADKSAFDKQLPVIKQTANYTVYSVTPEFKAGQ